MLSRRRVLPMLASAPAVLRGARRPPGDKPNLLFLWTDEQRADTMAAYSNLSYKVPAMNRLASESIVFDRCYVAQPVCTPSRSSVMTGLWPHTSGCARNNVPLPRHVKALPELLGDASYRTGYFGKWHLGDEVFPQHGFEEWAAIEDGIYRNFYSEGRDRNARSHYHHFLRKLGYEPDRPADNDFTRGFATRLPVEHTKPSFLAQEASNFVLRHRDEPWILYVNFLEPHMPFFSPLDDLHSAEEAPIPKNWPGVPVTSEPAWYQRRRAQYTSGRGGEGFRWDRREDVQRVNRNYAGLCSLVDQAVDRILWSLEASGAAENTIVVYTSDHGEMMGSHSLYAKQVMYEESARVPLLLRVPFRKQKPRRVASPVSHIDLVPTLLDLLGHRKSGGHLPGSSLVPSLEGKADAASEVFLEWTGDGGIDGPNARTVVTRDGYKLVLHDTDTALLFDRNRDPLEMHNLLAEPRHAATVTRLRKRIDGWQRRTGDALPLTSAQRPAGDRAFLGTSVQS